MRGAFDQSSGDRFWGSAVDIWLVALVAARGLRGASDVLEQEFDRAAADAERTIPLAAESD
jgi:hypothetical protein